MRTTTASRFPGHPGKRVTLRIHVHDRVGHTSLMLEFLKRARHAGLSGATAFEASLGYGESGHLHRTGLFANDAPVTVVIIDEPDRIESFLQDSADLLNDVLVIIDDVEILDR
jgi:PII-like signaling protein